MNFLSTSLFYKWFRERSVAADIYRESVIMDHIVRPLCLRAGSHLSLSRNLLQIVLAFVIFIFSFYNPVLSGAFLGKVRVGMVFLPLLLIAGVLRTEIRIPQITPFDLPVFLLFYIAILSLRTVKDIFALCFGLRELMAFSIFIMSIYLVIYIFTKKEIKKLFYALGLGGIGASLFFIIAVVFLKNGELYLKNTFGNPNHFGYFLVLIYPIALAISLDKKSKLKYLWGVGTLLIITSLFLTRSLGIWISFFISLPVLAVSLRKRWPLVFLILLIMTFILCPFVRHKFLEQISVGYGSTIMARIEVWKGALASIYERPILGVGLGQFSASAKPYYAKEMYNAFSVFFHLAATTGILGLTVFLWFLVRVFKLNISLLGTERLYGGALLTSLTAGVTGFFWDTHLLAVMTNWLLGMLWGSCVVITRKG